MSKDTDIIASTHTIATICPMLSDGEKKYLYRELRDLLPEKREARQYERRPGVMQNVITPLELGFNQAIDQVNEALEAFFQIEGNAV